MSRKRLMLELFAAGIELGRRHLGGARHRHRRRSRTSSRSRIRRRWTLMRRIKRAFDPVRHPQPRQDLRPGGRVVNGAEALIRTLVASGVDTCFMNPGTSEMHFVAALDAVPEMRGVLGLFEGVATGAADGYARINGQPGRGASPPRSRASATGWRTCTTPARARFRSSTSSATTPRTTRSTTRNSSPTSRPWRATCRHGSGRPTRPNRSAPTPPQQSPPRSDLPDKSPRSSFLPTRRGATARTR